MRGFFGGLVFGLAAAAVGAAMISLLSPLPQRPEVAADAPQAQPDTVPDGDSGGLEGAGRDADLVEAAPAAPGAPATDPDDLSLLQDSDTAPADKPAVGGATGGLDDPSAAAVSPEVSAIGDAPVSPAAPSVTPEAPTADSGVTVVPDQPAQPRPPAMAETGSGFGTVAPPEAAPSVTAESDLAPEQPDPATPATGPAAENAPAPSTETAAAPEAATQPGGVMVPEAPEAPAAPEARVSGDSSPGQRAPGAAPTLSQGDAPAPDTSVAAAPVAEPVAPRTAALPQAGSDDAVTRPGLGTPVVPLTERDSPAPDSGATAAPGNDMPPPIEAFAAPFENPAERPLMAIVLIDDDQSLGAEALSELGFPVSIAIDPSAPDAAAKMARHRAAGREVVALADLPAAASARDAEVSLGVWLDTLPEVVAILEGGGPGIQGNRPLADQVTAIAGATGHGLIFRDNGLNTAQKLAVRDGIPAAVVFRDFDGAGQTPAVMRRFLDQAAFRAGQQGAVIMLGRIRPDTMSALALWGLQDRAERVALAPVSAVLTAPPQQ